MRYAIIDGSKVRNVVVWDGVTPWDPGLPVVQVQDGEWCGPGCQYDPLADPRFFEDES